MSPDATILTIREGLETDYVRRVLQELYSCQREFGSAKVRIQIDSDDEAPNYRIEADAISGAAPELLNNARSGATHRPMAEKSATAAKWSSEAIKLDAVAKLLGSLRNYKPPRKKFS